MSAKPPIVVVLAGPNGAGKTTSSERLLRHHVEVSEYVNADAIARGLSAFDPANSAMPAGRVMLERLQLLADERANFAFETTLASRSFAPWLKTLIESGYEFHLVYVWLPSPDVALARVAARVRTGGHDIPAETVRRRYVRGLRNLFDLYMPIATGWAVFDGARPVPNPVARGSAGALTEVLESRTWATILARRDDRET